MNPRLLYTRCISVGYSAQRAPHSTSSQNTAVAADIFWQRAHCHCVATTVWLSTRASACRGMAAPCEPGAGIGWFSAPATAIPHDAQKARRRLANHRVATRWLARVSKQ